MGRWSRAWWWRVAAVVSVLIALLGLVGYDLPGLMRGADEAGDPYWMVIASFAVDVAVFIAAYGAWRRQAWGVVLLVVVDVFNLVLAVGTVLDPADDGEVVVGLVSTAVQVFVLWCCLGAGRRDGARAAVADARGLPG